MPHPVDKTYYILPRKIMSTDRTIIPTIIFVKYIRFQRYL